MTHIYLITGPVVRMCHRRNEHASDQHIGLVQIGGNIWSGSGAEKPPPGMSTRAPMPLPWQRLYRARPSAL